MSERKAMELEQLMNKRKTHVRETKPHENYLDHVYEQNKKITRRKSTEAEEMADTRAKSNLPRALTNVASHKELSFRNKKDSLNFGKSGSAQRSEEHTPEKASSPPKLNRKLQLVEEKGLHALKGFTDARIKTEQL